MNQGVREQVCAGAKRGGHRFSGPVIALLLAVATKTSQVDTCMEGAYEVREGVRERGGRREAHA